MSDIAQRFVIVDLRIPFVRLVLFFVKAALAAIPAAIIVGFLLTLLAAVIAAIVGDGGFVTCGAGRFDGGNQLRGYSVGGRDSVSSGGCLTSCQMRFLVK